MPGRRTSVGTVFRMPTSKGDAYLQYTHRHASWGALVWVAGGLHKEAPDDIAALLARDDGFFTFLLIDLIATENLIQPLGRYDVPRSRQEPPLFRDNIDFGASGQPSEYRLHRLWGEKATWSIGRDLTPEQRRLPILTIANPYAFSK